MRWRPRAMSVVLPAVLGCQAAFSSVRPPLDAEGEVYVYLQPAPSEAARLSFSAEAIAARAADGRELPLLQPPADPARLGVRAQRLLAWGRLPPGSYAGLSLRLRAASLDRPDGKAKLLVPEEAVRVEAPFAIERGRAATLWLLLDASRSFPSAASFAPAFAGIPPPALVPGLAAYVTSPAAGTLTMLDRHTRQVVWVAHLGGEPQGVAFAEPRLQAYVALAAEDAVAVVDLPSGSVLTRIRLRPGDRPREVAATPDGRLLVVVNRGSETVSFLDPVGQLELGRLSTGREPERLLLDRAGRRGFVCNRMSGSVTVIDLANRAVAGTLATEAEPIAAQLNRAEDRLYVAHAASPFLGVYSARDFSRLNRGFVGMGVRALRVDPRTDLLYVATDFGPLAVYEPVSLVAVGAVEVHGGAADAVIDDAENTMLLAMPGYEGIAAVDLAARREVGAADTAGPPFRIAVAGERR